jgi:deoxyribonuclease IV
MSIVGGHDRGLRTAHGLGFSAVQLFTKSCNQWRAKPLTDAEIASFRQGLSETEITNPVGHTSYLINLGTPDDALWRKSIDALVLELERGESLGMTDLVIHPGAHVGSGEEAGLARIARAIDEVQHNCRGFAIKIDLETTAGQGSNLGYRFEHLAQILNLVAEPERLGVCADTCHLFAAGYPLGTRREYNKTIDHLDRTVGTGRVRVWHLNDSQRELGSRVDRHAGIGRGHLGLEPFRFLINDPRFHAVPMILETPKGTEGDEELDAINLRVLQQLWNRSASRYAKVKSKRRDPA